MNRREELDEEAAARGLYHSDPKRPRHSVESGTTAQLDDEARNRSRDTGRPRIAPKTQDEVLMRDIIAAFTRYTDDIEISTETLGQNGELMNIMVNRADHPRVMGGMSKHIQALRTIFDYIAHREGRRIRLMLLEPERGMREERAPFIPNDDWRPDNVLRVLRAILDRVLRAPYALVPIDTGNGHLIEIRAAVTEVRIARGIQPSLNPIIHAIGKNEGAEVFLETPEHVVT